MGNENEKNQGRVISTASRRLRGGGLLELIYQPDTRSTAFAVFRGGQLSIESFLETDAGERLVPISASNNLIKHKALLLPGRPEPYGSIDALLAAIKGYLYRYVDLSERFQRIASYYILLTWVYDAFNELPYLRLRRGCQLREPQAFIFSRIEERALDAAGMAEHRNAGAAGDASAAEG